MVSVHAKTPAHWQITEQLVGSERLPVIIIDNALEDPEIYTRHAAQQNFTSLAPHYPGVRAKAPHNYLASIMPGLLIILRDRFGYEYGADVKECYYSLLTTPPDKLKPMQRIPHFDGVGDEKVAALHYLSQHKSGGTYFYKHRSTGFESVPNSRFATYRSAVSKDADRLGVPHPSYPDGDTDMFERTFKVSAVYNRLVLYKGISIHAVGVPHNFDFSQDPQRGRLTVNTFLTPASPSH